jgi:hypothetical protein
MAEPFPEELQESARIAGQVIARVWSDDDFKQQLIANPNEVLRDAGMDIPPGLELRILENTENLTYITLPPPPAEELSDDALEAIAAGSTAGSASTAGTVGTASCPASTAATLGSAGTAASQ